MKTADKVFLSDKRTEKRKADILGYVTATAKQGIVPSVRDIARAVGIPSPSTVQAYLTKLEAEGLIRTLKNGRRTVRLLNKDPAFRVFPVISGVSYLGDFFHPGKILSTFALRDCAEQDCFGLIQPDSGLTSRGILRGDLLICVKTGEARDGDLIVYADGVHLLTGVFTVLNGEFIILTDTTRTSCAFLTVIGRITGLRRELTTEDDTSGL